MWQLPPQDRVDLLASKFEAAWSKQLEKSKPSLVGSLAPPLEATQGWHGWKTLKGKHAGPIVWAWVEIAMVHMMAGDLYGTWAQTCLGTCASAHSPHRHAHALTHDILAILSFCYAAVAVQPVGSPSSPPEPFEGHVSTP